MDIIRYLFSDQTLYYIDHNGQCANHDHKKIVPVGGDPRAHIRAANAGAYDLYNSDSFSGFLQPSTLYITNADKV
jgi:tryptophanyl-tRNA synthetase